MCKIAEPPQEYDGLDLIIDKGLVLLQTNTSVYRNIFRLKWCFSNILADCQVLECSSWDSVVN